MAGLVQNLTLVEIEPLYMETEESDRWQADPMEGAAFASLPDLRILRSVSSSLMPFFLFHNYDTVCWPDMVTLLNWTPIFEWYMARLVLENGHQKGRVTMRSYAQFIGTVLGSFINTTERSSVIIQRKR